MKGLILNHFYSVAKSITYNILLSIILVGILVSTQNQMALRAAAFLPFLLITPLAFEILQHDAKSGWNKFVITLPIKRSKFIQSHYLIFLILFITGLLITLMLFYLADLFIVPTFTETLFNYLFRGMGMALCLATFVYPLSFKLGTEKSSMIMVMSIGFAFGVFFLVYSLLLLAIDGIEGFDQIFSTCFLLVSVLLFIVSYFISSMIYRKKEF